MPVPKQRHNSGRGKRRRDGHRVAKVAELVTCQKCKKQIMPHRMCSFCGDYKSGKAKKETKSSSQSK